MNKINPKYKAGQKVKYKDYKFDEIGEILRVVYDDDQQSFYYIFDDLKFKRELPILINEKDIIALVH
jgi:hypothetical protein